MATFTDANGSDLLTLTTIREEEQQQKPPSETRRSTLTTTSSSAPESPKRKKSKYVSYNARRDTTTGRVSVVRGSNAGINNISSNSNHSDNSPGIRTSNALYVDATGMVAMAVQGKLTFDSDESSRSTLDGSDDGIDNSNSHHLSHRNALHSIFHLHDNDPNYDSRSSSGHSSSTLSQPISVHEGDAGGGGGGGGGSSRDSVSLSASTSAAVRSVTKSKSPLSSPSSSRSPSPVIDAAAASAATASETQPANTPEVDDSENGAPSQHAEPLPIAHVQLVASSSGSVPSKGTPSPSQDPGDGISTPEAIAIETTDSAGVSAGVVAGDGNENESKSKNENNIPPQEPTSPRSLTPPKKGSADEMSALTEATPSITPLHEARQTFTIKNINLQHSMSPRSTSNKSTLSMSNKSIRSLSNKIKLGIVDDGSVLSDTTPIVLRDPSKPSSSSRINTSVKKFSYFDEGSVLSETTPIVFREPSQPQINNGDDSLSETTPINFHEPSGEFTVQDGSDISETTPVKFNESSGHLTMSEEASTSEPFSAQMLQHRSASQTRLGIGRKNSSKAFTDEELEADADRDIVNVYLEAAAFAGRERLNLTEDIYSFVLACSVRSIAFVFAIYFIFVKYICYGVLLVNLMRLNYQGEENNAGVMLTKFLMVPVSVSMQEDLITVFYNAANKRYDALTYKRNMSATYPKWVLCNLLRAIDGIMGLLVNFYVMLMNTDILDIFLSFAALHFLQFIDDVIYELAEKGFFGHKMEQATIACKVITFTRRTQTGDKCNNFITDLDTVLLLMSIVLCYLVYVVYIAVFYSVDDNRQIFEGLGADP